MRRKRKGKPILQVLLIASLAINTTLSFVVLANRNRMAQATEKRETVASTRGDHAGRRYGRGQSADRGESSVSTGCQWLPRKQWHQRQR